MRITTSKSKSIGLLIIMLLTAAAFTVLVLSLIRTPLPVSARSADIFGPACGAAILDGKVNPAEWSSAAKQTFVMNSPGGAPPFTATLYVMNSGSTLYMGITIDDDEFSTYAEFLPQGDGLRIDFDNDHSGSLFALKDDVLIVSAGAPQFGDDYINIDQAQSAMPDASGGGTLDGSGAATRVGSLNHFEWRHPLCSGDSLDFCIHPNSTVGFRLEYLDAQADGSFGSNQFFPALGNTSEADIVIGQCSVPDLFIYLPLITK